MSLDAVSSPAPQISLRLEEMKAQRAVWVDEEAALVAERAAIERLLPRLLAQAASIDANVASLAQEKAIFDQAIVEMEDHYKHILEVHAAQAASHAAGPGAMYDKLAALAKGGGRPEEEGEGTASAAPTKPARRAVPPPPPSESRQ